jgi:Holliday junction resolvasome RuvABC endonuclease subunit
MGSKGKVFHIAENTAVLKYLLHESNIPIEIVPPTVLKKFATGSGRAKKEDMHIAFKEQTGIALTDRAKIGNPYSDLVDAYFLARYGEEQ